MQLPPVLALALALSLSAEPVLAQQHDHGGGHNAAASPYAGLETRAIKSLSDADIETLRQGGGWGLALAAELNGVPGPAHLLELKDEIALSPDQVSAIEGIHAEMRREAIDAGERLIAAEEALAAAFAAGDLEEERLGVLIAEAEAARAHLRFVHLSRHLSTPPLLSAEQIIQYNALRGYGSNP